MVNGFPRYIAFGRRPRKARPSHTEEIEQIRRLTEEFLATGGTIEEVPPGATGETFTKATLRDQAEYRREKRARSN